MPLVSGVSYKCAACKTIIFPKKTERLNEFKTSGDKKKIFMMSWLEDLELKQMIERRANRIYILLISIYLGFGIFWFFFGYMNNDEGWYLYASRLVYDGKLPYIDFSYTQSPLLPYIYGIPQLLFGPSLYMGRLTSLFFGLLTCVFTAKLAEKLVGKMGAVIALALLCSSLTTIYYFTIVKTYALTSFLIIFSLYLSFGSNRRNPLKIMLPIFVMCLAVGVRLSVLPALLLLMLYLVYTERKNIGAVVLGISTGLVTCGILFVPLLLMNKDVSIFNLIGNHVASLEYRGLGAILRQKASTVVELVRVYFTIVALVVVGLILHFYGCSKSSTGNTKYYLLLFLIVLSVCAVQLIPTPTYVEYGVILVPVVSILAAFGFNKIYTHSIENPIRNTLLLIMTLVILIPTILTGFKDVRLGLGEEEKPISQIEEMGYYIKSHTPADGNLLAFSTYVAIAADRKVLPGFEMSIFSYYADWSTDKAREYHVINRDLLNEYIESKSAAAIMLTPFEIEWCQIGNDTLGLIEENYYLAKSMPNFGQWSDTAYLYLPQTK